MSERSGSPSPGDSSPEHTTPGIVSREEMERAEAEIPSGGPGAPTPPAPVDSGGLFQNQYREVTISAIIFGVIVGVVMNAAITYAGLKIGFTIVGSSIAAVLGFGVLRGMLRRGSILEVNIGQTIGSAVNTPNSGVIFTVPVLFLLGIPLVDGATPNMNFWLLTLACVAGAILGGAFIVPLRKQMLDIERLRFPSATAVGAILKSPGAGAMKSIVLVVGILVSALIAVPAQFPQITKLADVEELDELVQREKISYSEKLRTEIIDDFIAQESAPQPIIEHGRVLNELMSARSEADSAEDPEVEKAARRRVRELEAEAQEASEDAFAAVNALHDHDGYSFEYPNGLAEEIFALTEGEKSDWSILRSKQAGWAQKPLFGYSDLDWRLTREEEPGAEPVDYAYNGLGDEDPVLTKEVDRDRNGRADLVLEDSSIDVGRIFGLPAEMQLVFAIAPFALGAGYLTGRAGLFVLAGGILAYIVLNPILFGLGFMPASIGAAEAPDFGYYQINRPLGIGLLLGGAMMGVVASLPAIKEAFKSIGAAGKARASSDELGLKVLVGAALVAGVLLFFASDFVHSKAINTMDPVTGELIVGDMETVTINGYTLGFDDDDTLAEWESWSEPERAEYLASINADKAGWLAWMNPHLKSLIIAIIGALWIWFAGIIIAQCTGMTDWSPISGMALLTVVLVMLLGGPGDVLGAVMIGAALCVAITCAADMMADLKTGYIVGAQPKRQQTVEIISTGIGPLITMAVLLLIAASNVEKFGVPMGAGTDTTAPQAQALEAIITGVQGGAMPYALYGFGAVIGALLGLGSFAGLGVLVGLSMYLPMIYIATYGVGCLINMGVTKIKGKRWAEEWGVPLAAGFIVGDALLGLGVNMIVLIQS